MAKIFEASCIGGVVTCEGVPVDAEILTDGVGSSTGMLIIDGEKVFYVASSVPDLEDILLKLDDILGQIVTIATGLNAGMVTPGTETANIAVLVVLKAQLLLLKEVLR